MTTQVHHPAKSCVGTLLSLCGKARKYEGFRMEEKPHQAQRAWVGSPGLPQPWVMPQSSRHRPAPTPTVLWPTPCREANFATDQTIIVLGAVPRVAAVSWNAMGSAVPYHFPTAETLRPGGSLSNCESGVTAAVVQDSSRSRSTCADRITSWL